jgi:hypothetical protein
VAVLGSAVVIFAVLLFGARVLLARRAPVRALWPAAVLDAAAVTLALNLGAPLLVAAMRRTDHPWRGRHRGVAAVNICLCSPVWTARQHYELHGEPAAENLVEAGKHSLN